MGWDEVTSPSRDATESSRQPPSAAVRLFAVVGLFLGPELAFHSSL